MFKCFTLYGQKIQDTNTPKEDTCRKIPSQIQLYFYEVMSSQLDLPDWINAIKGKHLFMIHSDLAQNWEREFPEPLSHYKHEAKDS